MPLAMLGIIVGSGVRPCSNATSSGCSHFRRSAQIGYILLGASLVSVAGLTAGIVHLFNHALAKGALFLAVAGLAPCTSSPATRDLRACAARQCR